MTNRDIAHRRLYNQYISRATFENASDVVARLGALQGQDYLGVLWAIGLRMRHATEANIEQAIADRTIVRSWPMRGTLHYVAAADIRWLLKLMEPRAIASSAFRNRQLELDDATFAKSDKVLARKLEGGKQLTRPELAAALERAGISTANYRLAHILYRASILRLICFGARRGKQLTFTLFDEWVPECKTIERDEALAELARRYFTSHGPATLQDFIWWSGLKAADARASIEMVKPQFMQEVVGDQTYWFSQSAPIKKDATKVYLLPPFDEYTVAYKDRSAVLDPTYAKLMNTGYGIFKPIVVVDGEIAGIWKREVKKNSLKIAVSPFNSLTKSNQQKIARAADRYAEFLGLPAEVSFA
jgi:winged helix DNA-binding protein